MKQYDVQCPHCGTINEGLFLVETDGWMVCEHCGAEVQDEAFRRRHDSACIPGVNMLSSGRWIPALGSVAT